MIKLCKWLEIIIMGVLIPFIIFSIAMGWLAI